MKPPAVRADRPMYALGIRACAVFALSMMALFIRITNNHHIGLIESMFYRNAFAAPLVLLYIASTGGVGSIKTSRFSKHVTRTIVGLIGMALTFESYRELPLAEATTIGFTTPIFATILAATALRERVRLHRWSAVIIGFLGVLIVTNPGHSNIPLQGALISLASAFTIAVVSILLRQLGRTEAAATTGFWFCFLGFCILLVPMFWAARSHTPFEWAMLFCLGLSGAVAQVTLTASVRFAPISTVVSMDYTSLIWATLSGYALFGILPAANTWWGLPFIIGSGLYIAYREHLRSKDALSSAPIATT